MNGITFSASENYFAGISYWGSNKDESGRSLESVPVPLPESAPVSYFNDFQTPPLSAKDEEDEEVWEDDDEEDEEEWDDEDDWDDEEDDEDWDDEDDEDEDWDDEDDWDDEEDDEDE